MPVRRGCWEVSSGAQGRFLAIPALTQPKGNARYRNTALDSRAKCLYCHNLSQKNFLLCHTLAMDKAKKKEEVLEQLERERADFEGGSESVNLKGIDRQMAELESNVEELQRNVVVIGKYVEATIWAHRLKMAALIVIAPIYILGESETFQDFLGPTALFSGMGLAAALYSLARFLEGARAWIVAFALLVTLLIGGNAYNFYSNYCQVQAEELAWALNIPEERDYAFELLKDKEYLRKANVLGVHNIRPGRGVRFQRS